MNIGVIFGSRSPEHDVSIITGELVISGLKKLNYEVIPIYIDKNGRWYIGDQLGKLSLFTGERRERDLQGLSKYYLDLERSQGKLVFKKKLLPPKTIIVDIIFPCLHGTYGEDGSIQGLCEMFNIPYVGCDVASSAIAMDKVLTKIFFKTYSIPTPKFIAFTARDWKENQGYILRDIKTLNFPIFVKPARLGSSIGITKVKTEKDLVQAIRVALHYDTKILAEEGVEPVMDITCALLGNENPRHSLLQESLFQSDLFDYEEKYLTEGGAQLGSSQNNIVIPARLDEKTTSLIFDAAITIYTLLGCSGTARIDFLYNKDTREYFANEINPMPGTLYHHLWEKTGVKLDELLKELLDLAQKKHHEKQTVTHTFNSSILQKANTVKLGLLEQTRQ